MIGIKNRKSQILMKIFDFPIDSRLREAGNSQKVPWAVGNHWNEFQTSKDAEMGPPRAWDIGDTTITHLAGQCGHLAISIL